ncbi:tetratricopeptide repeat protein [Ancylomarina sp. 16SWW S1-10-2]|uniref:tetratricopeptide repeat protein n=1 Tax=Ancylomarina sp. 16SWW S1-10-2 TaxID=2499681 RepID=UPI0012AD77BB|nr:tetratricopeptide repeat protein [Ancylomarina sp. 16SWW S1-10-2]MRT92758.1 tetratricopeptide repeat protein [Ancylomarina sp. 16SWW S1-10-2]
MKKTTFIMVFLLCVSMVNAQKSKVTGAINYLSSGKLDKAKEAIDAGMDHEKCVAWPKTYLTKGKVYQAIFESPLPAYTKLSETPLQVAYEAYLKCIELDVKNKYGKAVKAQMTNLIPDFTNSAVKFFNTEDYAGALSAFEKVLEIENMEMFKADNLAVDTAVIFNAGLAAQKAKNLEAAAKYYKKTIEYNYGEAKAYAYLSKVLADSDKAEESLMYLQKGFEKYPDDAYMLVELINHYLTGPNPNEAAEYLDKAISLDPENASYYRAKGTVFEKTNEVDKAKEMYNIALTKDPKDYISYYNLGVIQLNVAEEARKVANDIIDQKKYDAAIKNLLKLYEEALPYFTKVIEIKPDEENSISTLKELYFKLRNEKPEYMKKYEEYKAKIDNM